MDSNPVSQDIPIRLPILLDGGTGTGLEKYGYDHTVSTAQFVCEHPEALTELQQSFIDAGSQILYTATHGANRENLKAYGVEDKTEQLNAAAAKITYDSFHPPDVFLLRRTQAGAAERFSSRHSSGGPYNSIQKHQVKCS